MAQVVESPVSDWTAADLVERFGAIPLADFQLDLQAFFAGPAS